MINIKNIKNQKINTKYFVELLFYSFPLSFIIGNLALSLHSLIFAILSLILIQKEKLKIKFDKVYWILISFFLYLILSTNIQFSVPGFLNESIENWPLKSNPMFKSFLLIRYLILFYILNVLIINNKLDIKKFFLSSLICTSFVSIDVIFQYISGFDFFGYKSFGVKNPGPFGDELIAGSYLQKFSFLSIFYFFGTNKNKKYGNHLIVLMITLHSVGMLLAGNRMPLLLFLFGCFLIILFFKQIRVLILISLSLFFVVFSIVVHNNDEMKFYNFSGLLNTINIFNTTNIVKTDEVKLENGKKIETKKDEKRIIFLRTTGHGSIYQTSYLLWKERPLFGSGLKSFRIKCWLILVKEELKGNKNKRLNCATHSHNYYLELLAEGGIIGLTLMLIFFIILLKESFFIIKKNINRLNQETIFVIPIIIVFFLEIWPLKSSGSFFTTWNATYFWVISSILFSINLKNKKKK